MRKANYIIYLSLLVLSCVKVRNNTDTRVERISDRERLYILFNKLLPQTEKFILKNCDTVFSTKDGCIISINKNTVINSEGRFQDDFILEVDVINSIYKAALTNIQTICNEGILQSGGMIFINILDKNGNQLKIAKNMDIGICYPSNKIDREMKMYDGKISRNGSIIWELSSNDLLVDTSMIIIPLDFDQMAGFFSRVDTIGKMSIIKNSYLSTWQFMNTFRSKTNAGQESVIYLKGAIEGWPLHYADSLAFLSVVDDFKRNYGRLPYYIDGDKIIVNVDGIQHLVEFYKQGLNKPQKVNLTIFGLNEKEKMFSYLLTLGFNKIQASNYINQYFTSLEIAKQRKSIENSYYKLMTSKLGYINIDKLYNEPNSIIAEILAKITNVNICDSIQSYLILPDRNVVLLGILDKNVVNFTNKHLEGYNKLPKGEKGVIVVIAYCDEVPYIGKVEIIITEKLYTEIKLEPSTFEEIKKLKNQGV